MPGKPTNSTPQAAISESKPRTKPSTSVISGFRRYRGPELFSPRRKEGTERAVVLRVIHELTSYRALPHSALASWTAAALCRFRSPKAPEDWRSPRPGGPRRPPELG